MTEAENTPHPIADNPEYPAWIRAQFRPDPALCAEVVSWFDHDKIKAYRPVITSSHVITLASFLPAYQTPVDPAVWVRMKATMRRVMAAIETLQEELPSMLASAKARHAEAIATGVNPWLGLNSQITNMSALLEAAKAENVLWLITPPSRPGRRRDWAGTASLVRTLAVMALREAGYTGTLNSDRDGPLVATLERAMEAIIQPVTTEALSKWIESEELKKHSS